VILANDDAALPVTNTRLLVDNFRALINAGTIFDHTPSFLPTRITLAVRFLSTGMLAYVAFPSIEVLVDGLMADLHQPSNASRSEACSGLRSARINLSVSVQSSDKNCLPLKQDCLCSSRNDCACLGRQPRRPLLRLNSREIVDLSTPAFLAIYLVLSPLVSTRIWYRCSMVSASSAPLLLGRLSGSDINATRHLNSFAKVALLS